MQETRVRFLDQEDPLEKEMATHSSILAWRIPLTEEPGGIARVRHDWRDSMHAPLPEAGLIVGGHPHSEDLVGLRLWISLLLSFQDLLLPLTSLIYTSWEYLQYSACTRIPVSDSAPREPHLRKPSMENVLMCSCFRMKNMGRLVNSVILGPLAHFVLCEMRSWEVCGTMAVEDDSVNSWMMV